MAFSLSFKDHAVIWMGASVWWTDHWNRKHWTPRNSCLHRSVLYTLSLSYMICSRTCHYVHYICAVLLLCPFQFRLAVYILHSANLSQTWSLSLLLSPIVNSELPACPHHCLQQCFADASWRTLSLTLTSATVTPLIHSATLWLSSASMAMKISVNRNFPTHQIL